MPNNISVIVTPKLAIVDEKILIEVSGLPPEAPVTIDSFIHHMGHMYLAFGHFFSRHDGTVVPSEQTSYGGSYTGILSMGLFTSMQPLLSKNLGARLIVKGCYQRLLCQTICQRTYLHPSVKRIEVEADHDGAPIRGTLFLPKNHAGPHPGVVDLFGGAAGCLEFRAALLAKAGFATLALGYIAYKDVPYKTFYDVPISYFDQVIDWFLNFPEIQKEGIGMIGVSMGSQMILLCNMRNPKVKASICINGPSTFLSDPDFNINPVEKVYELDLHKISPRDHP